MKKKGKPDPFAYVPLKRNALNKRYVGTFSICCVLFVRLMNYFLLDIRNFHPFGFFVFVC